MRRAGVLKGAKRPRVFSSLSGTATRAGFEASNPIQNCITASAVQSGSISVLEV
jgi:hypothetical protein